MLCFCWKCIYAININEINFISFVDWKYVQNDCFSFRWCRIWNSGLLPDSFLAQVSGQVANLSRHYQSPLFDSNSGLVQEIHAKYTWILSTKRLITVLNPLPDWWEMRYLCGEIIIECFNHVRRLVQNSWPNSFPLCVFHSPHCIPDPFIVIFPPVNKDNCLVNVVSKSSLVDRETLMRYMSDDHW